MGIAKRKHIRHKKAQDDVQSSVEKNIFWSRALKETLRQQNFFKITIFCSKRISLPKLFVFSFHKALTVIKMCEQLFSFVLKKSSKKTFNKMRTVLEKIVFFFSKQTRKNLKFRNTNGGQTLKK